jgi:DNA (cytosine-5)-methyltransferase 1
MDEDRGSLFHDIAYILEKHKPSMVVLENVRNIAGPRHAHEWKYIIEKLRDLGYRVSSKPFVVSPHKIPPSYGGTPQARERVFIVGTRLPSKRHSLSINDDPLEFPTDFDGWDPQEWNLFEDLPLDNTKENLMKYRISNEETLILDAWDWLVKNMLLRREGVRLPGFPLWADIWGKNPLYEYDENAPKWKKDFESKNKNFYLEHKKLIDQWFREFPILNNASPSKRKLEWQAGEVKSIYKCLIQLRPSGIRVKKMNYAPALVAITQTTIVGPLRRRLSIREVAQLQGLPSWFSFRTQPLSKSYKQLGNGISIGCAFQVLRGLAERDEGVLKELHPKLLRTIQASGDNPDIHLKRKP